MRIWAFVRLRWNRRRVAGWSRRAGLRLVRWRDAKLFEGPSAWSRKERHFRIQVVDAAGQPYGGFLTFRRAWSLSRRATVLWDDGARPTPHLFEREDGQRASLGDGRVLAGEDAVERGLHPARVAAPAGKHR